VRRYGPIGADIAAPSALFAGPTGSARAVALHAAGNYYVVGYTSGALPGVAHAGGFDAYIRMYSAANAVPWTRQFGTPSEDSAQAVIVDSSDHVIMGGQRSVFGSSDAFVRKYDQNGVELWTRDVGTAGTDYGWSLAADATRNIVLGGSTNGDLVGHNAGGDDAFVRKYSPTGALLWTSSAPTGTTR
jgi:hypothetical protein